MRRWWSPKAFFQLAELYPGRIDLGLGRAPARHHARLRATAWRPGRLARRGRAAAQATAPPAQGQRLIAARRRHPGSHCGCWKPACSRPSWRRTWACPMRSPRAAPRLLQPSAAVPRAVRLGGAAQALRDDQRAGDCRAHGRRRPSIWRAAPTSNGHPHRPARPARRPWRAFCRACRRQQPWRLSGHRRGRRSGRCAPACRHWRATRGPMNSCW